MACSVWQCVSWHVCAYEEHRLVRRLVEAKLLAMAYIGTKDNIADLPSRDAVPELLAALSEPPAYRLDPDDDHELVSPDIGAWRAPLASWLDRHGDVGQVWPS